MDSGILGGQFNVIQSQFHLLRRCRRPGEHHSGRFLVFLHWRRRHDNVIATNSVAGPRLLAAVANTIGTNSFNSTIGGAAVAMASRTMTVTSTIGGGDGNIIEFLSDHSFIGGGGQNLIQAHSPYCVIDGGINNNIEAEDSFSAIARRLAEYCRLSLLPHQCLCGGRFWQRCRRQLFLRGLSNQAQALNSGTFVWADSQGGPFASTGNNQFCIRAGGGVQLDGSTSMNFGATARQMLNLFSNGTANYGIGVQTSTLYFRTGGDNTANGFAWYRGGTPNTGLDNNGGGATLMTLNNSGLVVNSTFVSTSDRNAKQDFSPINPREILDKVAAMPITEWIYKADTATRHIGPMAQDFYAAFAIGPDDRHITTVDEGGVALAAIQGLNEKLESQRTENAKLKQQNDLLAERLTELEAAVKLLGEKK